MLISTNGTVKPNYITKHYLDIFDGQQTMIHHVQLLVNVTPLIYPTDFKSSLTNRIFEYLLNGNQTI